jgi:magnesium chelatase subunit I
MRPSTLAELRASPWAATSGRSVAQELRANLAQRLRDGAPIFPGLLGYHDTVVPQVVNAILSQHHFILLGLRGQAKTRLLRALTDLLDPLIPTIAAAELPDDPLAPQTLEGRAIVAERGDATEIAWLERDARYVEKLATPDVTVADLIGDIDPIKAARLGSRLGDPRAIHYGLLPRANRGIFAINELPDLAAKVQVALFNVMQEGDVQVKGYALRLPLDVLLVFSANPEDYTARGKLITPLKDRIGSEIRTHYPRTLPEAMAITRQEAWWERDGAVRVPAFVAEVVDEVAFVARDDARVDKHAGVSQRLPITLLESVVSNAEQRSLRRHVAPLARVADVYAGLPAITGKLELEYEGELKGGEVVAREIVRKAIGQTFGRRLGAVAVDDVVAWFESDETLLIPDGLDPAAELGYYGGVPALLDAARALAESADPADVAAAAEFVLEGLVARRSIARSEERGYVAAESEPAAERTPRRRWN